MTRRPTRDPGRRRTPEPFPGFDPFDIDLALLVCQTCRCLVPAHPVFVAGHHDWHRSKSPPTPPAGAANPGGVGGSNVPPGHSPGLGGTKRAGRGNGGNGEGVTAPAGADLDQAEQTAWDLAHAERRYGEFTR